MIRGGEFLSPVLRIGGRGGATAGILLDELAERGGAVSIGTVLGELASWSLGELAPWTVLDKISFAGRIIKIFLLIQCCSLGSKLAPNPNFCTLQRGVPVVDFDKSERVLWFFYARDSIF